MTRKNTLSPESLATSGRTGLAVLRGQPLHLGHAALIARMIADCDTVIIGFGSTQLHGESQNPFTFDERLAAMRIVFGDRFRPLQLVDIGAATSSNEWADYVIAKAKKMNLPEPTDYYTGSPQDAKWYTNRFAGPGDCEIAVGPVTSFTSAFTGKRLHIIDRSASGVPSASDIRSLIELRDDEWKQYVPARLIPFIEEKYPASLRLPLRGGKPPAEAPAGTRFIEESERGERALVMDEGGHWIDLPSGHNTQSKGATK